MRAVIDFPKLERLALESPVAFVEARATSEVRAALAAVEEHTAAGGWAVGFVSYEAAPAFDAAMSVRSGSDLPLVWFGIFEHTAQVRSTADTAEPATWKLDTNRATHRIAVESIRRGIKAGDYYQVNHTVRLESCSVSADESLYERMLVAQPECFGAYLEHADWRVLSVSPELFFSRNDCDIVMQPMKGTSPRGRWLEEDLELAHALERSEKERAENVMIVDLVRNDLGKIAEVGSVKVPELCAVSTYPTVLQMTSTVIARLRAGVALPEIFGALFPSGSVTGAPKVAAMRAIAELESSPRGLYCGAIGVVRPWGNCTFSVAIRTMTSVTSTNATVYGTGGGITWDSTPDREFEELKVKTRVLSRAAQPDFQLIETMRATDGGVVRLDGHMRRLADSAKYFGFQFDAEQLRGAIEQSAEDRATTSNARIRLLLSRDGKFQLSCTPVESAPGKRDDAPAYCVALADTPVSSADVFLFHKTTRRETYDRARAARPELSDVLLWNERDEVTEFTIGNVVLEMDGVLVTPPRECGLLAGVFREALLARGEIVERVVTREEFTRASRVWLINSLREWVPAALSSRASQQLMDVHSG